MGGGLGGVVPRGSWLCHFCSGFWVGKSKMFKGEGPVWGCAAPSTRRAPPEARQGRWKERLSMRLQQPRDTGGRKRMWPPGQGSCSL